MREVFINKLLLILILCLAVQTKGGVLLEPFLGYDQSSLKTMDVSGTTGTSTNSGMDYGARVGYRINQNFWIAIEYTGGSGKSKSDTAGADDSDYTKSVLGALIGYDSDRFRFWGGYAPSDKLTITQTESSNTDFIGTNLKVGLGYRASTHVSVNLEYIIPKYTKILSDGAEYNVTSFYSKFDTSGAMLSASFPFDLAK